MTPSTLASANDLAVADIGAPASTSAFQEPAQRTSAFVVPPFPRPTPHHRKLNEARALVDESDRGKWDALALRRDLTFRDGRLDFSGTTVQLSAPVGQNVPQGHQPGASALRAERLAPSPYALGQICARLGIPVTYLRQCPFILQDQNVNFWLRQGGTRQGSSQPKVPDWREDDGRENSGASPKSRPDDERWLLRARLGTLRAALSQHYSPLDNMALMNVLSPMLPAHYRVQWIGLEEESFHLRLIDPGRAHAVLPGDDFFVGVHIANSEVGMRSLTVDALVYRLVCSNGMVALVKGRSLLRQRHIHVAAPRFRAALEEALSQALGATETMLFQLQGAAKQVVPDAGVAIERLSRHWHLNETTEEVAKAALLTESPQVQESAYGLVNAFTAAAQTLPDEKRYDLEMLAGTLAQHGVPRFALAPREEESEARARRAGADLVGDDVVGYARELFGAREIRRQRSRRETALAEAGGEA